MSLASDKTTGPPPVGGSAISVNAAGPSWAHRFQTAAVGALVIGYAALSHYGASSPDAKGLGAALSIGPILLIGVILVWRWAHPAAALLIAALSCALLYHYWPAVERNYEWADLVQQCGAYGLIALSFARSLFGGRVPLCTLLAGTMHGALTPAETAYMRRATQAWCVFYGLLSAVILVLFFVVSVRHWSLFVNFAVFGLMILMGLADHAIRRRVLPRHPGGGILAVIRRSLIG